MSTSKKKIKKSVRMVRGILVVSLTLAFTFGFGFSLPAQETGDKSSFIEELSGLLESRGWTDEKITQLVEATKSFDWRGTEGADPEVVALALELGKREEAGMGPLEQAQLALELALTAVEMESLGYQERTVARAALNGVRNILTDIRRWREGGREGNLGELVRNRLRNEIRTACSLQVQEQTRERTRERVGGVSQSGFSQIPSGVSHGKSGDIKGRP
ncbi:MAG: hypothetical protein ACUVWJ_08455 [Spirochaetota bacterium]